MRTIKDPNRADAVKRSESIIEDFDSIHRYLSRLETDRARILSAPIAVVEGVGSKDRTNLSHVWISGKV
jgi:hypothetical protein